MPTPTSSSPARAISPAQDPLVRGLLAEERWSNGTISYSFADRSSTFAPRYGSDEQRSASFQALSTTERQHFASALTAWAAVADLRFVEVTETASQVGDLRVAYTWTPDLDDYEAWAYGPAQSPAAGDIWFNVRSDSLRKEWLPGSSAMSTVLHELGHALGLEHPFDSAAPLPTQWDAQTYTIMSYSAVPGRPQSTFDFHPTTPMLLDIAAIQHAYGANMSHDAGDTVHAYDDAGRYHETIWDAGGRDVLRYDGALAAVIDLRAGHGSLIGRRVHVLDAQGRQEVSNVWIARGVTIEDAIGGSGADIITGNEADNVLQGNGGDDRLLGGEGADVLHGGAGNDVLDGGAGRDLAVYASAAAGYRIARNPDGTLTVTDLTGNEGRDTLTGVERLRFGEHEEVAFDIAGNAGQAYRLYRAAFARTPDEAGLGYQVQALDAGAPLAVVASHFMQSPEFVGRYGNPDDAAFVTLLYRNVLERAPDDAGLAYHVGRLGAGTARPDVLIGFSESPENQAQVIGAIEGGISYLV